MEIQWTRMTGQWPVEASPLVGQFGTGGNKEILVLNRGGQLLLWSPDGTARGPGQDGVVAQLPTGQWTTTPTLLNPATATRLVLANVEGLAVALDGNFQLLWQHKLPGQTVWGRALPAEVRTASGPTLVFNDLSGTATCLTPAGDFVWTNALAAGPCKAPPQILSLRSGQDLVLIPAGSTLFCCDAHGNILWRGELGGEIVTRPEALSLADRQLILCGTAAGTLVALDFKGKINWRCVTGEPFGNWITFWSYECVAQVKSLSPLRYNRANAWRAKYFGLSGIGFWTHSTTEVDHWFAGKTINDEYALVYPGELPVPSVRWEAVCDGLEDVAAIALLEQQVQRHRQAGTTNERVQQAEQTLRLALRDVMELSDEAFVESRDFLREGDRVLGHTWTDEEIFRRHRAEVARLTLVLAAE